MNLKEIILKTILLDFIIFCMSFIIIVVTILIRLSTTTEIIISIQETLFSIFILSALIMIGLIISLLLTTIFINPKKMNSE